MNNLNKQQLPLPNNNLGIQTRLPLGVGILQNMNPFMTNMQPMINPLPFMHAANNFNPLQNNQLVPQNNQLVPPHLTLAGQQNGVGNMNCNPLFQVQGQNMMNGGQFNLSQAQGHVLAQNIASLLQQNSMNMQNGQFCAPLPLQNMNQQLPMPVSNPAQVIPYGMPPGSHPMCSFPNQVPQAMFPQNLLSSANMQFNTRNQVPQTMVRQNPFSSANLPLNHVVGNQVNQNEKNPFSSVNMQFNSVTGNQVPQTMVPQNPFSSANLPLNHVAGNQARPQVNQNEKNLFSSANMQFNSVTRNQVPQTMVPQNPFSSANLPLNHVAGNQVRPQVNQNEKNMFSPVKTNAFTSSPFSSQQLEGNAQAPSNPYGLKHLHAKHSQPAFTNSQAKPMNNVEANAPNPNWKGSPSKNFKNNPNRGRFQGGFQKSKFHDMNKGKKKFRAPKEHRHKGFNKENAGNSGVNYMEQNRKPKRSWSMIYTDQEIQQWREARKKYYPTKDNIPKKQRGQYREVFRRELKKILARQAELGVEVAEIPSSYLKDSTTKGLEGEEKRNSTNKRKLKKKFERTDRKDRHSKKQKFANKDTSLDPSSDKRSPTLLQKLLGADVKRDRSHLLEAFRFMVMNSFFQDWPDKPLRYPSVMIKENGPDGGDQELVNLIDDYHGNFVEDGDCDDNENDSIGQVNAQEESLDEESEEEGEIVD